MNLKEARKIQPGAIVRESYRPDSIHGLEVHGIVIGKRHVSERHHAKVISQIKEERYDIVVHWMCKNPACIPRTVYREPGKRLQLRQNWELMVVSRG